MSVLEEKEIRDLISKYKSYESLRPSQEKAICDILSLYNPDVEEAVIIELPVPTAGGKTEINTVCQRILAHEMGEDLVLGTTPLVELMRQFKVNKVYEDVPCLIGKNNYSCEAFKKEGLTAEDCVLRGKKKQKAFAACKYCEYRKAKDIFDNSSLGNTTFTRYMYDPSIRERTNYLFIDESASIERILRDLSSLELPIDIDQKNLMAELANWMIDLEDQYNQLSSHLDMLSEEIETPKVIKNDKGEFEKAPVNQNLLQEFRIGNKQLSQLEKKMQNVRQAIYYCEHEIKYLISKEDKNVYNKTTRVYDKVPIQVFKLLTAHIPFAGMIKNLKMVVLSSATPATNLLTSKEINRIETIHPIPVSQRPFIFDVVGSMSYNSRSETVKKMAPIIRNYHEQYASNTMCHCGSYPVAYLIYDELVKYMPKEDILLQVDKNGKNRYREGVLRNECGAIFKDGKQKRIWLSVEMNEGIDLAGEDYKLNLILKLPAEPWLSDYIVARREYDIANFGWNQYYDTTSANKLTQDYGRICRGPTDQGTTIALDKAILSFYKRYKNKLFPSWFNESVYII